MSTTPANLSSQKASAKPIAFAVLLNGAVVPGSMVTLHIRPEDLTRSEPSRTNLRQTIGQQNPNGQSVAGWADNFGLGIASLSINGHTGWRGTQLGDGAAEFNRLRTNVYLQWHSLRVAQQKRGIDPDTVEMVYLDLLNNIQVVVVPHVFSLKRSKSQALLYRYQIQLSILRNASVSPAKKTQTLTSPSQAAPQSGAQVSQAAVDAMNRTIAAQPALATSARAQFGPQVAGLSTLTNGGTSILQMVVNATSQGIDVFDSATTPVIALASQIQKALRNITQCIIAPLAADEMAKSILRNLYRSFNEAYCNLLNSFQAYNQFTDFEGLFGASNCSSTTGGRPASIYLNENPFFSLYTAAPPPAAVSIDARAALATATGDALSLNAAPLAFKLSLANRIAAGLPS